MAIYTCHINDDPVTSSTPTEAPAPHVLGSHREGERHREDDVYVPPTFTRNLDVLKLPVMILDETIYGFVVEPSISKSSLQRVRRASGVVAMTYGRLVTPRAPHTLGDEASSPQPTTAEIFPPQPPGRGGQLDLSTRRLESGSGSTTPDLGMPMLFPQVWGEVEPRLEHSTLLFSCA